MRPRDRTTGQSLVEFALVLPLLLALVFGIIELGILLNIYISLTNSAREGARAGAIYQYTGPAPETDNTTIIGTIDSERRAYVTTVISNTLNPAISLASVAITVGYTPTTALATNPYRSGTAIAVDLAHDHPLFFGLLGPTTITLRAASAMRIEPGGTGEAPP